MAGAAESPRHRLWEYNINLLFVRWNHYLADRPRNRRLSIFLQPGVGRQGWRIVR